MTTAGRRNRRVTFQRSTPTTDSHGGEVDSWATLADAFAEVLYGTGQERREAAQEAGSQAATFICLRTPTLATVVPKDRISFDGAAWDITSVAQVGLHKELHFTATRSI